MAGFLRVIAVAALAVVTAQPVLANPAIVVDSSSGRVLFNEEATRPWFPASLTKLMTAYTVFKALKAGRIDGGAPIMVSQRAARMAPSKMGYPVGTLVTIDDALKMIVVKSANDISIALAEGISGSVEAFVDEMNAHAQALGMRQSHWRNPNGLPDPEQYTSARDMALLARAILREFPQYAPLFQIEAIQSGKQIMRTHNALLYRFPGADGMKTGFICAAGFNVVATATRDGRKLITVILGAPTARLRSERAAQLFEDNFSRGTFFGGAGQPLLTELPASGYAGPTDIREDVCGRKRGGPAGAMAEGEDSGENWNMSGNKDSALATLMAEKRGKGGAAQPGDAAAQASRLAARWAIDPPVLVGPYTGDRKPVTALAFATTAAAPADAASATRVLKPGAIMPIAVENEAAAADPAAYAGAIRPRVLPGEPVAASAAEPVKLFGAVEPAPAGSLNHGKSDRLQKALPGQIPSRAVAELAADPVPVPAAEPAVAPDAAPVAVPLPPPRPRKKS